MTRMPIRFMKNLLVNLVPVARGPEVRQFVLGANLEARAPTLHDFAGARRRLVVCDRVAHLLLDVGELGACSMDRRPGLVHHGATLPASNHVRPLPLATVGTRGRYRGGRGLPGAGSRLLGACGSDHGRHQRQGERADDYAFHRPDSDVLTSSTVTCGGGGRGSYAHWLLRAWSQTASKVPSVYCAQAPSVLVKVVVVEMNCESQPTSKFRPQTCTGPRRKSSASAR